MTSILHVDHVEVVGPSSVRVRFDTGEIRRVNLAPLLWGPIFEPHHDPAFFAKVFIHPEARVLTWPNDSDLAPEALLDLEEEPDPDRPADFGVEESIRARPDRRGISSLIRPADVASDLISRFYGIDVLMTGIGAPTPSLTARDEEGTAVISLSARQLTSGTLSSLSLELLQEWMALYHAELRACWDRVGRGEAPGWIEPLE